MSYKGMSSPAKNKLTDPLKNGEKVKRLKSQHTEALAKTGLKPPKSPLK